MALEVIYNEKLKTLKLNRGTTNIITHEELRDAFSKHPKAETIKFGDGLVIKQAQDLFVPHLRGIKNIDISNVSIETTNVNEMFKGSHAREIKLPKMYVDNAREMFSSCLQLETIDISNMHSTKQGETDVEGMFRNCPLLRDVKFGSGLIGKGTLGYLAPDLKGEKSARDRERSYFTLSDYVVYQNGKERGFSGDKLKAGVILYHTGIPANAVWQIVERGIGEQILKHVSKETEKVKKGETPNVTMRDSNKKYFAQFVQAHNENQFKDFVARFKDSKTPDTEAAIINLINYSEKNNIRIKDIPAEVLPTLDIKAMDKNKEALEDLLNKLKTKELTACYSCFDTQMFKTTKVLFMDQDGYVQAFTRLKNLDERFQRFIKGVLREDGTLMSFKEYTDDIKNNDIQVPFSSSILLPYIYSQACSNGWIPDNDILFAVAQTMYNPDEGRVSIPENKNLWKIYTSNKCWSSNAESAMAFLKVSKIFGAFNEDPKVREKAENQIRTLTNYIPSLVTVDGYHGAKAFPDAPKAPIVMDSEITIIPGIPSKSKKCRKAVEKILCNDEQLLELTNGKKNLLDFLNKTYPLAELMDARSIMNVVPENRFGDGYGDGMPEGKARDIMLRIMEDLYVVTDNVDIAVDKKQFAGKEGKENLKQFRNSAEKYSKYEGANFRCLTSYTTHAMFGALEMKENLDLASFIMNHSKDILEGFRPWTTGKNIQTLQRNWDYIQNQKLLNRRKFEDKPTWKMSFNEINSILSTMSYERYGRLSDEKYDEVLECCNFYNYSQELAERTCDLYDKMCDRTTTSIPDVSGEYSGHGKHYTYKMLSLTDPAAIFFGQILDCCEQFHGVGESCMIHSCESQNGRVFFVFENNVPVAGSWTWRNGDTICFDNIECANGYNGTVIAEVYKQAAAELAGNVKEGDYINKVTFGTGYTDINKDGYTRDTVNKEPIEDVDYISDSRTQLILFDNQHPRNVETPSIYEYVDTPHASIELGDNRYNNGNNRRNEARTTLITDDRFMAGDTDYDEEEEEDDSHSAKIINDDIDDIEVTERAFNAAKSIDFSKNRDNKLNQQEDIDIEIDEEEELE